MKKLLYSLSVALTLSISLLSCSKGDYNSGDGKTGNNIYNTANASKNTFSAKINGILYVADWTAAYKATALGELALYGYKGLWNASEGITINISKAAVGTYPISSGLDAFYTLDGLPTDATSGSVTITEVTSGKVVGTFNMKGEGFDITEGAFDSPIK
ncbi:MAG: DUF6252 family protein [Phycisphaerales bacterium]|nr:DUF6252 family protein [Phycisphaerales bacterium]